MADLLPILLLLLLPAAPPERPGPGDVTPHACVGEGCAFGAWTADAPLEARTAWDRPSARVFALAAGERFEALDGVVVVEEAGTVEALRPVRVTLFPHGAEGPARPLELKPGDRLEVLRYLGEGFMVLRHGGALYEDTAFWEWRERTDRTDLWMTRKPRAWWWVKARNGRAQEGWVRLKVCYPWDEDTKECPASLVSGFSVLDGSAGR
jgi:hypothetical protein